MLLPGFVFSREKKSWRHKFRSAKRLPLPDPVDPFTVVSSFPLLETSPTESTFSASSTSSGSAEWSSPPSLFGTPTSSSTPNSVPETPPRNASWSGSSILLPLRIRSYRKSLFPGTGLPSSSLKGPAVRPFIVSHSPHTPRAANGASAKATAVDKCFVCEELLVNKLELEPLVPLQCGDYLHWECFKLAVHHQVQKISLREIPHSRHHLMTHAFPPCHGSVCALRGTETDIAPRDLGVCDELFAPCLDGATAFLDSESALAVANMSVPAQCRPHPPGWEPAAKKPVDFDEVSVFTTTTPVIHSPRPSQRVAVPSFAASNLDLASLSMALSSRSPSPTPTISTLNTVTVKIDAHRAISMDSLKSQLVRLLIQNCSSLSLNTLLLFGNLRLVDRLLASFDGANYHPQIVYLFDTHAVAWHEDTSEEAILLDIRDGRFTTPRASILKVSTRNNCGRSNIWLHSETASIIEKWVVACCDQSFTFPVEIITSTITIDEVKDAIASNGSHTTASVYCPTLSPQIESPTDSGNASDSTINIPRVTTEIKSKTPVIISEISYESDSSIDTDSDNEFISRVLDNVKDTNLLVSKTKIDNLFRSHSGHEDESENDTDVYESDQDSDAEKIDALMIKEPVANSKREVETEWNTLISNIDEAITTILH
ncbi:uncharacterized protein CANTADRAFT_20123 [Suhomyces tanzawaensis NRRL Y-17324]|uniref:Uncharacterized protein n=1 Tax=Suhomyces tanzawaensis NRRL Y-17324 TaxID=984487 RepID=A0A1E4SM22_9ASCO|nr:uncharacterized protein CANTADRAFT_20123 [Suhomyces tanzawaensis NRRL Y-17324]ODV80538.1 hypothetical protein CANTADRAFT_20123 [Suhomyces tanzawaensis NRRL Y-17324]